MIRYTEDFNKYYLESIKCNWMVIYPCNLYFPKHIVISFPSDKTEEIIEGIKSKYYFRFKEINLIDLYNNEFKEENICSREVALTKVYHIDECNDLYELINKEYIDWNTLKGAKPNQLKYIFETDFCNTILTKILIDIRYSDNVLVKYIDSFEDGFKKVRNILYNVIIEDNCDIVKDYNSIIETDNLINKYKSEFLKRIYTEYREIIGVK